MAAPAQLPTVEAAVAWLQARGARALASDSRQVRAGDAFLAWPGATHDARRFAAPALAAGAAVPASVAAPNPSAAQADTGRPDHR